AVQWQGCVIFVWRAMFNPIGVLEAWPFEILFEQVATARTGANGQQECISRGQEAIIDQNRNGACAELVVGRSNCYGSGSTTAAEYNIIGENKIRIGAASRESQAG